MLFLILLTQKGTKVEKFKTLGDHAMRFETPWPQGNFKSISRHFLKLKWWSEKTLILDVFDKIVSGEFVMIEWAPYLDVVMKEQFKITGKCDFSLSVNQRIFLVFKLKIEISLIDFRLKLFFLSKFH